ncbi:hypothetical protein B0T24DRAFT_303424 [Lasiosphaeria ovina]|uniref:Uncharacterized protein n=1 Tax=Lasiosphaeria ovina TaxID=92902 RepID=A0AAE0K798_9PEZI|nr:hypothetical protein B0T24DRAFT_303424 [Lasiosphaeria ovina]
MPVSATQTPKDRRALFEKIRGPPKEEIEQAVSMWSPGTKLELLEGSHIGFLKAVPASNGLFEVPAKTGSPVQMDQGGIAILDVRFVFQRKAGFTIVYRLEKTEEKRSQNVMPQSK